MKKIFEDIEKYSPDIMIGVGLVGMVTSTILAVKATPKAKEAIDIRKKELKVEKLGFKETVKCVWKFYIPSACVTVASAGAIVGSKKIDTKRKAVAVAACEMSERLADNYQKAVIDTIGEKKEKEIQAAAAQKQVDETKALPAEKPKIASAYGEQYFYDPYCQRFLWANRDKVLTAESYLRDLGDVDVSLKDWFDAAYIDFGGTGDIDCVPLAEYVGWPDPSRIHVVLNMAVTDKDGLAATVIHFDEPPRTLRRR